MSSLSGASGITTPASTGTLEEEPPHAGIGRLLADLNRLYRDEPALHARDTDPSGFAWIDGSDADHSILSFLRLGGEGEAPILVVLNFTPVVRYDHRVGVPLEGHWEEVLNTDAEAYGGSGVGNLGRVLAEARSMHGRPASMAITLPPLAAVFFRAPGAAR